MVIQIPVTTANLKYIRFRYQITDVLSISRTNPLGHYIQELLRPKPRKYSPLNFEGMPVINLLLLNGHDYSYLTYLPESVVSVFNQFMKDLMHQEFISHMEALEGLVENKEAIYSFIDKFGFDEHEVSFEALKKYHLRYRTREIRQKTLSADDCKSIVINQQLSLFAQNKTA